MKEPVPRLLSKEVEHQLPVVSLHGICCSLDIHFTFNLIDIFSNSKIIATVTLAFVVVASVFRYDARYNLLSSIWLNEAIVSSRGLLRDAFLDDWRMRRVSRGNSSSAAFLSCFLLAGEEN
jgi:hypothetical protein